MNKATIKTIKGTVITISQSGSKLNVSIPSAQIDGLPVKRCDDGLIATVGCGKHGVITFALVGADFETAHELAKAAEQASDAYAADLAAHIADRAKISNANYGSL